MTREETAQPSGAEPSFVARATAAEAEDKLVHNPTLAIYGDRDGFVAIRKLREWAARLEGRPGSKFRAHEVSSANHFWAQGNVASTLKEAVRAFGTSLVANNAD
jgi:alpha/beta superfamily hydrolase